MVHLQSQWAPEKWWSVRAQVSSSKFQVSSFKVGIRTFLGSGKVVVRERACTMYHAAFVYRTVFVYLNTMAPGRSRVLDLYDSPLYSK